MSVGAHVTPIIGVILYSVVPLPMDAIVTTRISIFLVGDTYNKASFATVTGKGDNPSYI